MPDNNNNNNLNINTNVFTFKGQVKVSDIQAAFDELIGRINNIIDIYNQTDTFIQKQDYTVGGDSIGAAGYTLTVGGIKQILNAYQNTLFGCRVFKIGGNRVAITDGVLFQYDKAVRIHSQILEGTGSVLYLDVDGETVVRGNDGDNIPEGCTFLTWLVQMGDNTYLNIHRGVQLEALPGFKMSLQPRSLRWGIDNDDTSRHRFQGGMVYHVNSGGASRITYQDLVTISEGLARNNKGAGRAKRMHISAGPANFLFIPKGCNSPIWPKGSNHVSRTNYSFDLQRGNT